MTDLDVTFNSVSIPTNTSVTLTVYEDVGDDGSGANSFTDADGTTHNYDNSASTTLSDGQTTYTLTGFDGSSGNGIYVDLQPDTTDVTATAVVTEPISVSPGGVTIAASAASLTAAEPSPSVTVAGTETISASAETVTTSSPTVSLDTTVTIAASTSTLTATEPVIVLAYDQSVAASVGALTAAEQRAGLGLFIGATVETLTTAEPSPAVRLAGPQTLAASVAALSATGPSINALTDTGSVGGGAVGSPVRTPDLMGVEATHDTLSLTWRTRVHSTEISSLRAFRTHAGEVSRVTDSEGGWEAFDTALDEGNTFSVAPPGAVVPPLEAGEYLVQGYRESAVSADGRVVDITVEFVRMGPRDADGSTLSETQSTGDWLFEFSNGTIATPYVTRSDQGGQETVELELVVDDAQAEVVLESATRLEAVAVEAVPDGDDFVRDNNADDRNTVTITQPSSIDSDYLPDSGSQFVVQDWRLRDRDDSPQRWAVELTVRPL